MSTTPAYQFDLAGLYLCETVAHESPLEPGVFHVPARCTLTPPPEHVPDDKWPRWNGSSWDLVIRPKPSTPSLHAEDPLSKLQTFLRDNPDVAALINAPQQP